MAIVVGSTVHTPAGVGKVKEVKGTKVIVTLVDGNKIPQEYDMKDVREESYSEAKYGVPVMDIEKAISDFKKMGATNITVDEYPGGTAVVFKLDDSNKSKLIAWFKKNYDGENPDDYKESVSSRINKLSEDWDMSNGSMFTTKKMSTEQVPKQDVNVDATDIQKKGFEAEKKEHPEFTDEEIMQIVKDHLSEDPQYYSKQESVHSRIDKLVESTTKMKETLNSDGKVLANNIQQITHQLDKIYNENPETIRKLEIRPKFDNALYALDELHRVTYKAAASSKESTTTKMKEGSWPNDFSTIAKMYKKDSGSNDPEDLNSWLDHYAMSKNIEDRLSSYETEQLSKALKVVGIKIDADDMSESTTTKMKEIDLGDSPREVVNAVNMILMTARNMKVGGFKPSSFKVFGEDIEKAALVISSYLAKL